MARLRSTHFATVLYEMYTSHQALLPFVNCKNEYGLVLLKNQKQQVKLAHCDRQKSTESNKIIVVIKFF